MRLACSFLFALASFVSVGAGAGLMTAATAQAQAAIDITVASLDNAWNNRHEMHGAYVDFGTKRPPLPEDYEVAWRVARAVYYGGWFALPPGSKDEVKESYFKYGVDAGEKARKLAPNRVEGHYWYASVYGGYGLAKGIRASLGGAPLMRDAATEAIRIDPKYHFGGPYRVRGRLYFALPGIISFGDNKKAREDLLKAVEVGPESKLNYVYLAEVVEKLEGEAAALKLLDKAAGLPGVAGVKEEEAYLRDVRALQEKWK